MEHLKAGHKIGYSRLAVTMWSGLRRGARFLITFIGWVLYITEGINPKDAFDHAVMT